MYNDSTVIQRAKNTVKIKRIYTIMEKMKSKNVQPKMTQNELLEELYLAIKDIFVATIIKETDTSLTVRFLDGKQFRISLEDISLK